MQGTVYEKTNAEVEMKKINREEFWEQAKVGGKEKINDGEEERNPSVCIICINLLSSQKLG